jgi:soluble lytic murein transglycosylase-like protein
VTLRVQAEVPVPEGLVRIQARITEIKSRFPGPDFREQLRAAAGSACESTPYDDKIAQAATREGLDPKLLKSMVRAESGFNPAAVSPVGAMGLMQLMPNTAAALGVTDPFDPDQNLAGGARYLRQQLDRFGDTEKALAAYNAGPGAVARYGGVPPYAETQAYVSKILGSLGTEP